ncbi:hypothetical protein [Arthrobacter sp. ISL-65]|uniref:hypothetical protein n=1 Tax=Arthrobacter sp. ISL-65 TaxID=2819112 RepID=UPI001BE74B4C|nr:hypothetical protein [Arthrobacter sp. ISL-65]MBT2548186.1 hypothetical protein [Arthrobacter sp. ISL-65]
MSTTHTALIVPPRLGEPLRAEQLMHDCGLDLAGAARGPAIILGRDAEGKDTSIPEHLLRLAAELFGTPQAA